MKVKTLTKIALLMLYNQPITQNIFNAIGYQELGENTELMLSLNTFKSTKDCWSGTCS